MTDGAVPAADLGVVRPFDRIEWVDEVKFGRVAADVTEAAKKQGALRKFMSRGEQGLFVQYSTLPAGFHIAPHTHSHGEVLFILEGSCTVEPTGEVLGPNDSAVVPANHEYGLRAGDQGMRFLTIRAGDAQTDFGKK
jgi:mannose-6-phosphate isomerase-like protein (cupin superfamily)